MISRNLAQFAQGFHSLHTGAIRHWNVVKGMMRFTPSATANRSKLDDSVQRHCDPHALLDARIPKVCHQTLNDTDVTHNQRWRYLLLHVNHNACQARHQVSVAFTSGKTATQHMTRQRSVKSWMKDKSEDARISSISPTVYDKDLARIWRTTKGDSL